MASTKSKDIDRIKGTWSPEEDEVLQQLVQRHGPRNWSLISKSIPGRSGKSCRLRWCNQLSPQVEHRPFTPEEDDTIIRAHRQFGNKWATISRLLNGRTDNAIKNHWNSTLKRKYAREAEQYDQDDCLALRPLKRANSDGGSVGLCLTPGSPPGSDVSDSSNHSDPVISHVYRLVTRPPVSNHRQHHSEPNIDIFPSMVSMVQEDHTSCLALTLSLPGSMKIESHPQQTLTDDVVQNPLQLLPLSPAQAAPVDQVFFQPSSAVGVNLSDSGDDRRFAFSSDFLAMMQEMIRTEVRSYMNAVRAGCWSDVHAIAK